MRKKYAKVLRLAVLIASLTVGDTALAQEEYAGNELSSTGIENKASKHAVSLLGGISSSGIGRELTLGVEYEYSISELIGVSGGLEFTPGRHENDDSIIGIVSLNFHIDERWTVAFGLGKEKTGGQGKLGNLARVGISYDFNFGSYAISPSYSVDVVGGVATHSIGVDFGKTF